MEKPTDDQVFAAIRERPSGTETYVLRNILRTADTPFVRRACQRLEKRGLVKRVPTPYAVMIRWAPVDQGTNHE